MAIPAQSATIEVQKIQLDIFRLPDGSYRLNETGCLAAIGESNPQSFREFLRCASSGTISFKIDKLAVEGQPIEIDGIPFDVAVSFWSTEALKGNKKAIEVLMACALESLKKRIDA